MVIPMFIIYRRIQDNLTQNFPEHQLPGGKYVLKMDQALSDLNVLADVTMGFNQDSVDKAVEIMQLRQKAMENEFPVKNWHALDARVEEARGYLSKVERSALRRALKLKEEERKEDTSEEHVLDTLLVS